MHRPAETSSEQARLMLGILDAVERHEVCSQRRLASELGIALGLVNAYLKRCVTKGLIKVREAPARRFAYYLTPRGFSEKSRLTLEYLSHSFQFFREARADCAQLFLQAKARGIKRIVVLGRSDLAEIAALCALEQGIVIVGVVAGKSTTGAMIGLRCYDNFDDVPHAFDAVFVAELANAQQACKAAVARFGLDRVLIPELLRVRIVATKPARRQVELR